MANAKLEVSSKNAHLMDMAEVFPGIQDNTYLSTCTRGLLPKAARDALDEHLDALTTGRTDKAALFEMIKDVRASFATLINADPSEIAYTKNVSEGLNIIATAMKWQAGDNVILTPSVEHPNNIYPWLNLGQKEGVEVRTVDDDNGRIDVDAMIAVADDRTRLITVPTVTFSPGLRTDVKKLGQFCRANNIFLLVDAAQSAGVLHTDVEDMMIDGLATSTQKGLCSMYGMGFLYCRREWADQMVPAYLARFGVDLGHDAPEAAFGSMQYKLMDGALRFDLGNYNFPVVTVAQQSLKILHDIGTENIDAHVVRLATRLAEGFEGLGLNVINGHDPSERANIVCVGHPSEGHDTTDDAESAALHQFLLDADVLHTIRRGMLRFAFHIYNTDADVDRVLELVSGWKSTNSK